MNQAEIAIHFARKKKIAHYPRLPKYILLKNEKGRSKMSKPLAESCERGFRKRLSNWMGMEGHAELAAMHTPKPKAKKAEPVVADEEE